MARKITPDQIVEYLLAGGDAKSAMKAAGINQMQLVAALLSKPETLGRLRNYAQETSAGYQEFDPSNVYDETASNDVADRYAMWDKRYQPLINEFFGVVKRSGGGPEVDDFASTIEANLPEAAKAYGLSETELPNILERLKKDADNFVTAEVNKKQKQFSAFQKQREKLAGDYGTPEKGVFADLTGTPELLSLPSSIEELAKQRATKRTAEVRKKFKGINETQLAGFQQAFEKSFAEKARKAKVDPRKAGTVSLFKELMKKTLG